LITPTKQNAKIAEWAGTLHTRTSNDGVLITYINLKDYLTSDTDHSYFCIYCMREIIPEKHSNGHLYIHDEVPHPDDFRQQDEKIQY